MAKATFDQLKAEVVMKAEEAGTLPTSVSVGGTQYMLEWSAEAKMAAMQVVHNPARLDDALDQVTFTGLDGSRVTA